MCYPVGSFPGPWKLPPGNIGTYFEGMKRLTYWLLLPLQRAYMSSQISSRAPLLEDWHLETGSANWDWIESCDKKRDGYVMLQKLN